MNEERISLSGILEYFILFSVIIVLGLSYSIRTPFMGDEVLNYYLGSLPSISLLYQGLSLGADSHGPIYHTLNWLWTQIGEFLNQTPEIWTRSPSIILICLGLGILKHTIDSKIPQPFGLILVLCLLTWEGLLVHLGENRSYGWVIFLISIQIYLSQKYYDSPQRKWLIGLLVISALSILSHPMAFAYSLVIASSLTISIRWAKNKWDLHPLLWFVLGSTALIPWLPYYFGQVESTMDASVKWAEPPNLLLLIEFLKPSIGVAILLCILLALSIRKNALGINEDKLIKEWLTMSLCILAFSIFLWIVSQWSNPLFLQRYVLSAQIGWILMLGSIIPILNLKVGINLKIILYTFGIGLLAYIFSIPLPTREVTGGFWNRESPWTDAGFSDEQYFKEDIPILCESSTTYLPRKFYYGGTRNYFLIINTAKVKKDEIVKTPTEMDQKMSKALKAIDKRHHILEIEDILKSYNRFYLLNETFLSSDTYAFPCSNYKKTLLNAIKKDNNHALRIELIEKKRTLTENYDPTRHSNYPSIQRGENY